MGRDRGLVNNCSAAAGRAPNWTGRTSNSSYEIQKFKKHSRKIPLSGESSRPLTPILLQKYRDTPPFLSRYFCRSMPSSWQKVVYTSPMCITIRLPFVSRCLCRSRGSLGHPQRIGQEPSGTSQRLAIGHRQLSHNSSFYRRSLEFGEGVDSAMGDAAIVVFRRNRPRNSSWDAMDSQ